MSATVTCTREERLRSRLDFALLTAAGGDLPQILVVREALDEVRAATRLDAQARIHDLVAQGLIRADAPAAAPPQRPVAGPWARLTAAGAERLQELRRVLEAPGCSCASCSPPAPAPAPLETEALPEGVADLVRGRRP